jgi:hypothetical protein
MTHTSKNDTLTNTDILKPHRLNKEATRITPFKSKRQNEHDVHRNLELNEKDKIDSSLVGSQSSLSGAHMTLTSKNDTLANLEMSKHHEGTLNITPRFSK